MRNLLLLISLTLTACSTTSSIDDTDLSIIENKEATKPTPEVTSIYDEVNNEYNELVRKLKVIPSFDDVKRLKKIYVETSFYKPYLGTEKTLSNSMYSDIENKDWHACLAVTREILRTNYISINGHYGAMACSVELKKKQQSEFHRTMINFLLDDIWQSGNGRTPETSFEITSSAELYAFLNLAGLEVMNQSLLEHQNKSYDRIGVKDPETGDEFDLFFDITTQWEKGFKSIN